MPARNERKIGKTLRDAVLMPELMHGFLVRALAML
jgi:hypothetical protein